MSIQDVQQKLRRVDVVFVIDTTSSMGPAIAEVKKRLQEFAAELARSDLRPTVAFGVVAYRDHPPEDSSYVTQVHPLVESVAQAQKNIEALQAMGGGDGPEAILDGLHDALDTIKWREHAHKVILLVGDAPPHGFGGPGDRWPKGCPAGRTLDKIAARAQSMAVPIHAIGVKSGTDEWWTAMEKSFRQIAAAAGGEFVPLGDIANLIPRILKLLYQELGKAALDINVYEAWSVARDKSAPGLAVAVERPAEEVEDSLKRLRAKGVLVVDDAQFLAMLRDSPVGGEPAPPAPPVEADLLDRIKIIATSDQPNADGGEDVHIVLLGEPS